MAIKPTTGFVDIDEDAVTKVLQEGDAAAFATKAATAAFQIAVDLCPVDDGDHRDALYVQQAQTIRDDQSATAFFGSTSSTWHLLEYGSIHNSPFRTLTQAAERAGFKFDPTPEGTNP